MRTRTLHLKCDECGSKKIDLYSQEGSSAIFWIMIIIGIFLAPVGIGIFLILASFYFRKRTIYYYECMSCHSKGEMSESMYFEEIEEDRRIKILNPDKID